MFVDTRLSIDPNQPVKLAAIAQTGSAKTDPQDTYEAVLTHLADNLDQVSAAVIRLAERVDELAAQVGQTVGGVSTSVPSTESDAPRC